MTENEAKNVLKMVEAHGCLVIEAKVKAIQALEELQQYRAIGTVEQLEWCKDASHWKELFKEKLEQYEAIGTVEELKAIKNDGGFTDDLLNMGYTKGIKDGYVKSIDECIKIIEETVWKDTDMLAESIRELKGVQE